MDHCSFPVESFLYLLLTKRQRDVSWTEDPETNYGRKVLNTVPAQLVWKAQTKFHEMGDSTHKPRPCSLGEACASPNLAATLIWEGRQAKRGDSVVHCQDNSH